MAFTPWTTLDDYLDLIETLEGRGLLHLLDPVQLSIRLLVPPGLGLLELPDLTVTHLDAEALTWRWSHPDPRMDALQQKVARAVEAGARRAAPPEETLAEVKQLALAAAGRPHAHLPALRIGPPGPRLTEPWFC